MKIKKGESHGAFVKRVRQTARLTQEQFARQIGFSVVTISKWENGANVPLYSLRIVEDFARNLK